MAASSHPPGALPPPSTQPFRFHNPFGSPVPDPHGAPPAQYNSSDARAITHHQLQQHHQQQYADPWVAPAGHHRQGTFIPPPPPPPYDSGPQHGAGYRGYGAGGGAAAAGGPPPMTTGAGLHGSVPTSVYVAPPKIEMQPWARKAWRWLVNSTTGVARVDLRRPTPPLPEQYDGNLLVVRSRQSVTKPRDGRRGAGFGRQRGLVAEPVPAYTTSMYGQAYSVVPQAGVMAATATPLAGQPLLMGARIKITRSFLIGGGGLKTDRGDEDDATTAEELEAAAKAAAADGGAVAPAPATPPLWRRRWTAPSPLARSWAEKPLLDIGVGVNLDVDQQQVQPVARIKIKDLVSIKAAPLGLLKISRSIPLGPVALKVRYELPLAHATRFWEPPARLMVRLDNAAGSGIHLTPGGLEFDEQVVQFGNAVSLRASASLGFPRQLPLEEGEPPLKLQLHRLSLKSIW